MDSVLFDPLQLCRGWVAAIYVLLGFGVGTLTTISVFWHLQSKQQLREEEDFEHWARRISDITGHTDTGFCFAKGSELRIVRIDNVLSTMLGYEQHNMPASVHDIVPAAIRITHRNWMKAALAKKQLPGNLIHPLRNVEVMRCNGKPIRVNVSIGILNARAAVSENCLFFALVTPVSGQRVSMKEQDWRGAMAHMYGVNVAQTVANGHLPSQECYNTATVLFLDICNFTRSCMERDAHEVAEWMRNVHNEVEAAIHRHNVRKIETRGDCYVCATGTNAVPGDAHHNQVQRMLNFARDASNSLREKFSTQIRVGISTGAVTISFIKTHQFAPTMCIFGDTVCTAARMEQSGSPSHVHFCKAAAERMAEETGSGCPPLHRTEVKSKGVVPTAFYSCQRGRFLLNGERVGDERRMRMRSDSAEGGALDHMLSTTKASLSMRRSSTTDI